MSSLPPYFPQGFALSQARLCAQLVGAAYDQFSQ